MSVSADGIALMVGVWNSSVHRQYSVSGRSMEQ